MTISGERTEQLHIFYRVTGFTSDFLSFIGVELIRFFHRTLQLYRKFLRHTQRNVPKVSFTYREEIIPQMRHGTDEKQTEQIQMLLDSMKVAGKWNKKMCDR